MTFNFEPLSSPILLSASDHWNDVASEVIVSGIELGIELLDLHLTLKKAFEKNTSGVNVDLSESILLRPEPGQECRIRFSRPLENTLVETTINHALDAEYRRIGLLFDPRFVHMTLANI